MSSNAIDQELRIVAARMTRIEFLNRDFHIPGLDVAAAGERRAKPRIAALKIEFSEALRLLRAACVSPHNPDTIIIGLVGVCSVLRLGGEAKCCWVNVCDASARRVE
jgi:hypothetical protein